MHGKLETEKSERNIIFDTLVCFYLSEDIFLVLSNLLLLSTRKWNNARSEKNQGFNVADASVFGSEQEFWTLSLNLSQMMGKYICHQSKAISHSML